MPVLAEQRRRLRDAQRQQLLRRLAHERRHARDGFVEHARQRIHITATVKGTITRLLRAHVGGRAGDRALLRDLLVRAVNRARDAEVREHRVSAGKQNVLGLDVPVHDTALVRVGECAGNFAPNAHRLLHGQAVVGAEPLPHRVAFDVWHHVKELVVRLPRIVDGENVWMLKARGELDLAKKALSTERVRELRVQHLDCDEALVPNVVRQVHRRCAPTTNLTLQDIASGESFVEKRRNVEHGYPVVGGRG